MKHGLGRLPHKKDDRDLIFGTYVEKFPFPSRYHIFRNARRNPLPVLDQGQVPACVGFSSAIMKLSHERKEHRRTIMFNGNQLYEPVKQPQGGAYIRDMLKYLQDTGAPHPTKDRKYPIDTYVRIPTWDIHGLKRAIYLDGPVLIGFWVFGNFMEADASTTPVGLPENIDDAYGGHAATIIAYDENDNFLIHNSWGESWGTRGEKWVSREFIERIAEELWTVVDRSDKRMAQYIDMQTLLRVKEAVSNG